MSDATDDDRIEKLEQRVEQLEGALSVDDDEGRTWTLSGLMSMGLSRRQALHALGLIAVGASMGSAVATAFADTASAAGGTIGTSTDPLDAIYVNELHQSTDHINTDGLTLNTREVYVQDTAPSSPSTEDVWIDTTEATQ